MIFNSKLISIKYLSFISSPHIHMKKYIAECLWTMILVIFWCWVAVWTWVDITATALAFWLVIVALAYAIGPISWCHVNPAVSLWVRLNWGLKTKDFYCYIAAQFIWGIIWAFILWILLWWDFSVLGANGLDRVDWNIRIGLLAEIILTFVFVYTILWVTSKEEYSNIAGIVIWLALVLVHLLWLWLTGTSVNPARSFWPALFEWIAALKVVWIFIIAPLAWWALAAYIFQYLNQEPKKKRSLLH